MKLKQLFVLLILSMSSCAATGPQKYIFANGKYQRVFVVKVDTMTLFDSARKRIIPITIYNRDDLQNINDMRHENIRKNLVLLNPGYEGIRSDYSYIANNLAINGYLVVTIQHDLATDDAPRQTGDIYKARKPFWDRGVKSVFFVTAKLKKDYIHLDYNHITLIGHSNGGDIVMLIAGEYPQFATTIITLDNRRVPIPRSRQPKIFSIRSGDQPADANVLPSPEEQKRYKIKIVKVSTKHNDMNDTGTDAQKKEINDYIIRFLK